jgi:hypothetical protein
MGRAPQPLTPEQEEAMIEEKVRLCAGVAIAGAEGRLE